MEEAARQQLLEVEKARMAKEREANDSKLLAEKAELNRLKLEEAEKLQAQNDEEELRLRKEMLRSIDI